MAIALRRRLELLLILFLSALVVCDGRAAEKSKSSSTNKWVTLNGCRFFPEDYNDGDSFHAKYGQREFIFRLYFVDTPETDDTYPERIREQCEYFGVTIEQAHKTAAAAKAVVAELLKRPFVVTTRWQNAMGRSKLPRYYAFVEVDGHDLAELLVRRGLARAKGVVAILPNGTRAKDHMAKLKQVEDEARTKRAGIWGHSRKADQSFPAKRH